MRSSHGCLNAGVGDVAADSYILSVFAGVKWYLFVDTIHDRPLSACALDAVHVDGTST